MTKPAPPDLEERTPLLEMVSIGGYRLRVAYWPTAQQTDNRPILFFNGIGANLELISPFASRLHDRVIITFDMPGVGGSASPKLPYRLFTMARVACKICDKFKIRDVDVLGVSWGGALAQQFAFQYSNRVGKLILCATTAGMTMIPGKLSSISKMMDTRRYTDPQYMSENFQHLYGDIADIGAGTHVQNLVPPTQIGYLFQLFAVMGWSSLPFARCIRMPVLVMAGSNDVLVPMINAHILTSAIPNARLHRIEGGGHLFLVTRPNESSQVITDFLAE
ncbi:MAG: alpha/beta fold hydrolase [Pseudomonadota bacterium]